MAFSNPIIGANDTLIREAIQSENYVTGVSGWRIEKTGNAEFNSITVRGNVAIGSPSGSQVLINTSPVFGTGSSIQFPTNASQEVVPSGIYSWISNPGTPGEYLVMTLQTAKVGAPADGEYMQVRLTSEGKDSLAPPDLEIHHVSGAGVFSLIADFSIDEIYLNPAVKGGGTTVVLAADSSITNQATMQQNNLAFGLVANAVYEIDVWASFTSTVPGPASAATLIKTDWDAPLGTTGRVDVIGATGTASGYTSSTNHTMKTSGAAAFSSDIAFHLITGPQVVYQHGILRTGATAGSWFFRYSQNTAQVGQTLTLQADSVAHIKRVG